MSVSNVARLLTFMFAGMAHLGCSPPEHRTAAVLADPGAAIGKRTTARINAGTEITAAMLRSVPLVKRGEVVRILLESGPMTISAVGQSQEDGGQGDLIRVQNIASKRVIFARVTGHSQVRVEF